MEDCLNQGIDYRGFIEEQARGFWGRGHLFGELSTWLTAQGPRFFAIIGGPGSGKTAIAARLAQFAMGSELAPNNAQSLQKDFLSALHFCSAFDLRWTGDRRWYQPHVFAESLSSQLAARYLEFGKALLEKSSNRQITITADQHVDKNTGQVIGIYIKHLDASRLAPEDAFSYLVREPLEELAKKRPNERFVLLIDALDESLRYSGAVTILRLLIETSKLSPQVRFIVSTRPGQTEFEQLADPPEPQMQINRLDQEPGLSHGLQDIYSYVLNHPSQPELSKRLARGLTPEQLAAVIRDRSAGNFLYVDQLLQMLATGHSTINHAVLDALPKGLFKFYRAFLKRVLEPVYRTWEDPYQPILGTLAVEREALNRQQLADIVNIGKGRVVPALTSVRQLLSEDDNVPASQRTYTFYHRSLADFLLDEDAAEEYWCDEIEQHERVAAHYLPDCEAGISDPLDPYGLRNLAFHLVEAAYGRKQLARHRHVEITVNLLCNPAFEQVYQAELDDPIGWREDLIRALRVASVDNYDQAPTQLIKLATAYLAFRKKYLQPRAIFDLVEQGEINAAERRLGLFAIDNKWRQAARLAIIWAAITPKTKTGSADARQQALRDNIEDLFKRINDEPVYYPPIPLLMARVYSALYGAPLPPFSLPDAPREEIAQALVARMGGMTALSALPKISEQLPPFTGEPLNVQQSEMLIVAQEGGNDNKSIFAASQEAPLLVSYADQQAAKKVEVDSEHDYIGAYIRIHAANNYIRYRNGSLWVILDAILQHRDQTWVRDRVVELVTTALASSKLEYQENLPLALLAWRALAHMPDATSDLEKALTHARQVAANLQPQRGKNDTAGSVTRRLAGLAEVHSHVLKEPDIARELIVKALNPEVFGFAGLYAPAALTLAEAIRVSLPNDQGLIDAALNKAVQSAHRIQDARFCAQTTARWNALKQHWWGNSLVSSKFEELIRSFADDIGDARFAALHRRGEAYDQRPKNDPDQFPIPPDVDKATTLAQLADVYERPLAEFERVNPDDNGTQEWVNVPDPDFAPLLAARLAAEALVIDELTDSKRIELIQLLIPAAVTNPTALDTILARLLLAIRPKVMEIFKELPDAVKAYQECNVYTRIDEGRSKEVMVGAGVNRMVGERLVVEQKVDTFTGPLMGALISDLGGPTTQSQQDEKDLIAQLEQPHRQDPARKSTLSKEANTPLDGQATPQPRQSSPKLLTPSEAATYLTVTEADVIDAIHANELKAKKIGSTFRIKREDLDAFLNE